MNHPKIVFKFFVQEPLSSLHDYDEVDDDAEEDGEDADGDDGGDDDDALSQLSKLNSEIKMLAPGELKSEIFFYPDGLNFNLRLSYGP